MLKQIHADLGFSSRRELVESLVALEGGARVAKRADATSSPTARRRRTRITPEMKQGIIDAVKAGTPGAVVAQHFGVSVQSIQNVKKAAGLVRQRAASADESILNR